MFSLKIMSQAWLKLKIIIPRSYNVEKGGVKKCQIGKTYDVIYEQPKKRKGKHMNR